MKWILCSERQPPKEGFYTVRGLNNQGNPVTHEDKDKIWFTGKFWVIREGCKVTEWRDESESISNHTSESVRSAEEIENWYKEWCKKTKRNGGTLIGSSIKELLTDFASQSHHVPQSIESIEAKSVQVNNGWREVKEIIEFIKSEQSKSLELYQHYSKNKYTHDAAMNCMGENLAFEIVLKFLDAAPNPTK